MPIAAGADAWIHAAIVLAGGTVLCFLLLARAELMDVWVEIARNTRAQPTSVRYPGIAFLSFILRLAAYLLLAAAILVAAGVGIGIVQTPTIDLKGILWPEAKKHETVQGAASATVVVATPADPTATVSGK